MRTRIIQLGQLALLTIAMAACSDQTSLAARVNQEPITTEAVDVLLVQRDVDPANASDDQRKSALDDLIAQALLVQQAYAENLQNDPELLQATRQLLAQAYLEKQISAVREPSEEDLAQYYDEHPQFFAERRKFQLQEIRITADDAILREVDQRYQNISTLNELVTWLSEQGIAYETGATFKTGDELPVDLLGHLTTAQAGEVFKLMIPGGVSILQLVTFEPDPVPFADARSDIARYIHNRIVEHILEKTASELRQKAKIEFFAPYAMQNP